MSINRPILTTFRIQSCQMDSENQGQKGDSWAMSVKREVDVGYSSPKLDTLPFLAQVRIKVTAIAKPDEEEIPDGATFTAVYLAKLEFTLGPSEKEIEELLDNEDFQYLLVAQSIPLAMNHVKEQFQLAGFNVSHVKLGIN